MPREFPIPVIGTSLLQPSLDLYMAMQPIQEFDRRHLRHGSGWTGTPFCVFKQEHYFSVAVNGAKEPYIGIVVVYCLFSPPSVTLALENALCCCYIHIPQWHHLWGQRISNHTLLRWRSILPYCSILSCIAPSFFDVFSIFRVRSRGCKMLLALRAVLLWCEKVRDQSMPVEGKGTKILKGCFGVCRQRHKAGQSGSPRWEVCKNRLTSQW